MLTSGSFSLQRRVGALSMREPRMLMCARVSYKPCQPVTPRREGGKSSLLLEPSVGEGGQISDDTVILLFRGLNFIICLGTRQALGSPEVYRHECTILFMHLTCGSSYL